MVLRILPLVVLVLLFSTTITSMLPRTGGILVTTTLRSERVQLHLACVTASRGIESRFGIHPSCRVAATTTTLVVVHHISTR